MLTRRQTSLYRHKMDIWRTSRTIGAVTAGKPGAETCTRVASNVPCIYQYNPNIDEVFPGGRIKGYNALVLDKVHCEASTDIRAGDFIVNVTTKADGSRAANYGEVEKVEGAPTITESLGNRRANQLYVEAQSDEHPPTAITGAYT